MEPTTSKESVSSIHKEGHLLPELAVEISDDLLISQRNVNVDSIQHFETLPPYNFIFEEYLMKNVPFILGKAATVSWKSRKDWLNLDGTPNFQFLRKNFGDAIVPVANCHEKKYSAQPKTDMTLSEYLEYWESYIQSEYSPSMENHYLKDWHFTRHFPEYEAYCTPVYFTSDWLNEFWDTQSADDDYRFVYMGPKGSWTPFHADVLRSFSWSANICGRKKWILFPPGEEEKLKDRLGNIVYDADSARNPEEYPCASAIKGRQVVIQEAGEVIYVPSGWYHQVYNMEDTISINHNWINGCNIDISWSFLRGNLAEVQQEISDCLGMEGWDTQCQMILKASSGTDYYDFYNFILTIANTRLKALKGYLENSLELKWTTKSSVEDSCGLKSTEVQSKDLTELKETILHVGEINTRHNKDVTSFKDQRVVMHGSNLEEGNNEYTEDMIKLEDCREVTHIQDSKNSTDLKGKNLSLNFHRVAGHTGCLNAASHRTVKLSRELEDVNGEKTGCLNAVSHRTVKLSRELKAVNGDNSGDIVELKNAILCRNCHRNIAGCTDSVDHRIVMPYSDSEQVNDSPIEELITELKVRHFWPGSWNMSKSYPQVVFDLNRLKSVLVVMLKDKDFACLDFSTFTTNPTDLLVKLTDALYTPVRHKINK